MEAHEGARCTLDLLMPLNVHSILALAEGSQSQSLTTEATKPPHSRLEQRSVISVMHVDTHSRATCESS